MEKIKLRQWGDQIFYKKAESVPAASINDPVFQDLLDQMYYTMQEEGGVGLAAPMLGHSIQVAMMGYDADPKKSSSGFPKTFLINPEIVEYSKDTETDWEGNLSFPGVRGLVPRPKTIRVKYLDRLCKEHDDVFSGFPARIVQHEIDHLNGIVFVERMTDMKTLITESEFRKQKS